MSVIVAFVREPYSDMQFVTGKLSQRATSGSAIPFIKSVALLHYLLRRGPLRFLQAAATNVHTLPPPPSSQDAGDAVLALTLAGSTACYLQQRCGPWGAPS
jgi:hypothetical protein